MSPRERDKGDERRLELREEEVEARKRPVEVGEVRVRKQAVTEKRQLEVPVYHDVLVLERRIVRRRPNDPREIGRPVQVVIPLHREEAQVRKHPVVREEVRVSKRQVEDRERLETQVAREDPRVEAFGDARVSGEIERLPEEQTGARAE
jgi:uncharacterized protein (TIGR02271 family)